MERSNGSSDDASSQKNGPVAPGKQKLDLQRQQSVGRKKTSPTPPNNHPTAPTNTDEDSSVLMQQFTLQPSSNSSSNNKSNNNDNALSNANDNNNSTTSNLDNEDIAQKATAFASSVVYFSVLQKISQPVTVSFTLTPNAEQWQFK